MVGKVDRTPLPLNWVLDFGAYLVCQLGVVQVSTFRVENSCIGWSPITKKQINAKDEVTLEAERGIAEIEQFLAEQSLVAA